MCAVSSFKDLAPADSSEEVSPVPLKCLGVLLDVCAQTRGPGPKKMRGGAAHQNCNPRKIEQDGFVKMTGLIKSIVLST